MLRFDQEHAGAETYGVDLATPDFVKLAESFGIRATAVDGLSDAFGKELAAHLADPSRRCSSPTRGSSRRRRPPRSGPVRARRPGPIRSKDWADLFGQRA